MSRTTARTQTPRRGSRRRALGVSGVAAGILAGTLTVAALTSDGAAAADLRSQVARTFAELGHPEPSLTPAPRGTVPAVVDGSGEPRRVEGPAAEVPDDQGLEPGRPAPGSPATLPSTPPLELPADIPEQASQTGRLVEGMPTDVVVVPPRAEVVTSSVARDGGRVQVTLEGTTSQPAGEVLAFYREHFAQLAFAESTSPASPGATAAAFTRQSHGLVVTATPAGNGTAFTLAGVLSVPE